MRQPAPVSAQSGGPSSRASSAGDALRGLLPRPLTLPAPRGSSERALSMLMRSLPLPLLLEPARPRPRLRRHRRGAPGLSAQATGVPTALMMRSGCS